MVKMYYHIACIHPALSVSSVAGSNFTDGTCVIAQWVLCAFRHGKGFLYEWPLAKTAVKLWFIVLLRGLHSILLNSFHIVKCVDCNFQQFSIPHDKVKTA